jgi:hypothetical protein
MLVGAVIVGTIVGYLSAGLVLFSGGTLVSAALSLVVGGAAAMLLTAAVAAIPAIVVPALARKPAPAR